MIFHRNCWNMAGFLELNNDQRRETVNARQRYQAWRNAADRERGYRGSMVWEETKGTQYLLRSYYDENGSRRQKSLGKRSPETELIKQRFDSERKAAIESRKSLDAILERQAAVNRAVGLGRVPLIAAKILRLIDKRGLLGNGLRVAGTNSLCCYEAACGVFVDPGLVATLDIDLLFDSRRRLNLVGNPDLPDESLIQLLRLADRSFRRTEQSFRAENDEGYLVDLIKPMHNPPWRSERRAIGAADDIQAAEIQGLIWLENAPPFEQVAIDERGYPVRMVACDPRVFAIHKYWISAREDRDPLKKTRDSEQARAVASLTTTYLPHLPFDSDALRMIPRDVLEAARDLFA
jgi:hypothetical protein